MCKNKGIVAADFLNSIHDCQAIKENKRKYTDYLCTGCKSHMTKETWDKWPLGDIEKINESVNSCVDSYLFFLLFMVVRQRNPLKKIYIKNESINTY